MPSGESNPFILHSDVSSSISQFGCHVMSHISSSFDLTTIASIVVNDYPNQGNELMGVYDLPLLIDIPLSFSNDLNFVVHL